MNSLYIRSGNDFYTARTNSFQQIISKRGGQVQGGFSFSILYPKEAFNGQAYQNHYRFLCDDAACFTRYIQHFVSAAARNKR